MTYDDWIKAAKDLDTAKSEFKTWSFASQRPSSD